jgi:predicted lactoylglutathione lyase
MTIIDSISLASEDPAAGELFVKNAFGLGAGVQTHAGDEPSSGFRGFTLSVLVPGPSDVRALAERALAAGASAIKEPAKSLWGFGAVLTAPDGTIWKIASRKKKDSGAPTGRVEDVVLLLGVADVAATKAFYIEHGIAVAKSYGSKYVEFETGASPVKLALYKRKALAKDAGVEESGTGSHRLVILADAAFTDPDGFEWKTTV